MRSMSASDIPARRSAFGTALIGPTPMTSGSTPAAANVTNRASGVRPNASAFDALHQHERRGAVRVRARVAGRDRPAEL